MSSNANKSKLNLKEKLTDDNLDLSLSGLEVVPVKEIVRILLYVRCLLVMGIDRIIVKN